MAETTLPPNGPDNLVLAQLRAIRGILDDHTRKFDEVIGRLSSLEYHFAGFGREMAGINQRLDNLDRRVTRIELRLDLVEDTTSTSEQ